MALEWGRPRGIGRVRYVVDDTGSNPRRRPLVIAGALTLLSLGVIGFGFLRIVEWLRPPPIEQPPLEMRSEPGLQRFVPQTRRALLARRDPASDEEEPPAVPPDHPFAKTRITGRVFDLEGGEGIAGALVRVKPTFGMPHLGAPSGDGSAAFTTREDGSYAMKGIPPGSFDLEVHATGYAPARSSFKKFSALEDDDGFDVALSRGGALEGRVLSFDGRPVPRATVSASTHETIALHELTPITLTNEEGRFVIDPVDAREIYVYATHPSRGSRVVVVPPSEAPSRDVEIVLAPGRLLRGRVRDEVAPVPGARVVVALQRFANQVVATSPTTSGAGTETDKAGAFELRVSESGPIAIIAQAPGYEMGTQVVMDTGEDSELSIEIVLQRGVEFRGVVLGADRAPAVRAHVFIAPTGGRPPKPPLDGWTDTEGRFRIDGVARNGPYKVMIDHFSHPLLTTIEQAIGGEHRYLLEAEGRILGSIVDASSGGPITRYQYSVEGPVRRQSAAVSISGAFEIDQLPKGAYTIAIDAEGYASETVPPISIGPGETVSDLVVRLRPAGSIVGHVRGPSAGVMVVHAWDQESQLEGEAVVSADGAFSLNDLPSGMYTLTAYGDSEHGELRGETKNVAVESGGVTKDIEILVAPVGATPG